MFDEILGANENDLLYKGIVSFMIVGLKQNVPYVIKSVPETKIEGRWLKGEIKDCLKTLHDSGFNVRALVCDNDSTNISAYSLLLKERNQVEVSLFMMNPHDKNLFIL